MTRYTSVETSIPFEDLEHDTDTKLRCECGFKTFRPETFRSHVEYHRRTEPESFEYNAKERKSPPVDKQAAEMRKQGCSVEESANRLLNIETRTGSKDGDAS